MPGSRRIDPVTDLTRWRLTSIDGRRRWHFISIDGTLEREQNVLEKYSLGLDCVSYVQCQFFIIIIIKSRLKCLLLSWLNNRNLKKKILFPLLKSIKSSLNAASDVLETKGNKIIIIAGNHRFESFKTSGQKTMAFKM